MRDDEFDSFYAARAPALRRVAYVVTGDWHEAEDVVNSAFANIYARWHRIRPDGVEQYTKRAVLNGAISAGRRARREVRVAEVEDVAGAPLEFANDVNELLVDLTRTQRAVVALRFLDDLSVARASELLGIAEGTVKSHTARAMATMRTALAEKNRLES